MPTKARLDYHIDYTPRSISQATCGFLFERLSKYCSMSQAPGCPPYLEYLPSVDKKVTPRDRHLGP